MPKLRIGGSIVALVTPFKNGAVDEDALRKLVRLHMTDGTRGVLPCGTTGESPTLTHAEFERVVKICVEEAKGKTQVIAGTGTYSTAESVARTKWAKQAGVDAVLAVCPYYNKPSQEGIYLHYKAIAQDGGLPVIVYTIPGRSVVNIVPDTIARLAQLENIVAVKEASGNLNQMTEIISLCAGKLDLVSGDDALTLPVMAIGGTGIISVAANVVPRAMAELVEECAKGNWAKAKEVHYNLLPLFKALFLETNPIPVKAAMELSGLCSEELRLPLTPLEAGNSAKLEAALRGLGLLK